VLRVPVTKALRGGISDCRNPALQKMFLMIGLGEKAGSGMAKIQQGWRHTGGIVRLEDSVEPFDHTLLRLDLPSMRGQMTGEMTGQMTGQIEGETPEVVLELLKNNPEASIPEIARHLGKSVSTIGRAVRVLKSEGRLAHSGATKSGRWIVADSHGRE